MHSITPVGYDGYLFGKMAMVRKEGVFAHTERYKERGQRTSEADAADRAGGQEVRRPGLPGGKPKVRSESTS